MDPTEVRLAVARLVAEVRSWPGVSTAPHRFGGTAFRFGRGEIGHVHEHGLVDVPFPRPIRDEIVARGDAHPHHTLPSSGWVSWTIGSESDLTHAQELLKRSYVLRLALEDTRPTPRRSDIEDAIDEAVEESFPASDPPAHHSSD
jgi:hypothetical protein